ncbi:MAG: pyruvate carboxyltransferase [Chloroflexaceae bacterium]|nr:pyruvate carboxyltransferase [Chloroflexaceae bacterium]
MVFTATNQLGVPVFLVDQNPASEQYHQAAQLFALYDYLKQQGFGVFSIRESLQAVSEGRDGTLQGFYLSSDEAWESVQFMERLGVGVVELPAFPLNQPGQASNRRLIARAHEAGLQIAFAAHARCVALDVQSAHAAGFRRIHLYIGTSKIKQATAGATVTRMAEKAYESIALARQLGFTSVRISTEDAFRTTLDDYEAFYTRLQELLAANDVRVNGVGIPDTVGVSTLEELGDRIAILQRVGIQFDFLECHIHNDVGNADQIYLETLLLCMRLGITMLPDFSILGIGERNGTIGLSSLLEAIYRRLIQLYPRRMPEIRQAVRERLGRLPSGELFVNVYNDADKFFYNILARTGFIFDRSPFSSNTEYDGSGVHADTTLRAFHLALAEGRTGQEAIEIGNSAYCGALPLYDMPLRTPVLACFGCGKSNVRYWRERADMRLRPPHEVRESVARLGGQLGADGAFEGNTHDDNALDEYIARAIRIFSVMQNGMTHQEAMELLNMFYFSDGSPTSQPVAAVFYQGQP